MSETQTSSAAEYNPFDEANASQGGGLWDGKTVTITSAVPKQEALKYGAAKGGGPVLDKNGNQSILTALTLTGISEGSESDKERHEEYSVGDKITVGPGGFAMKDGSALKFHTNSNFWKLRTALTASGFDIGSLLVRDAAGAIVYIAPGVPKQDYNKLVGAKFVFKAEAKLGKDGKSIKDGKGYDKSAHFPVKYLGTGGVAARPAGNGNGSAAPSALEDKAVSAVLKALAAAKDDKGVPTGKLVRSDLVRALSAQLKAEGEPDQVANGIIGLAVQDSWHAGKSWKYDGLAASL